MAGEISSLGIGSGVLTADIIDKLRANEETSLVKPLDTKIETNDSKVKALDLLDSLITTFKSSTGSLGDELLYLQREGSVAGEGVSVSVEDGVNIQEFSIRVDQLAKSDVVESGSFTSTDKSIASGDGTMSLNINNKTYDIDYDSSTTLEGLRDEINKVVGADLTASILQVGDSSNKLILTSDSSGADQEILMTDSGNLDSKILNKNAAVFSGNLTSTSPGVSETIADGDITINGTSIGEVVIPGTTNSEDKAGIIAQAINDAGVGATASVIENNGKFSLYIENSDGGVGDLTIATTANGETISGLADSTTTGSVDGATTIQAAKDAKFQYNGIDITRSTNEVSDLRNGITISLLKVKADDEDLNNVSVTQDTADIVSEMETFSENYNAMMKQFDALLGVNIDEGTVGLFNGDSTLRAMQSEISRAVTSVDSRGNSLANFGIDIAQDGTMSFNADKSKLSADDSYLNLSEKLAQEPDEVERFFAGGTYDGVEEEGIFTKLDNIAENFTSTNGRFTSLMTYLDNQDDTLATDRAKAVKLLDSRYDTMTQRFAAYDSMISQVNAQFASLNMQIQSAMNG